MRGISKTLYFGIILVVVVIIAIIASTALLPPLQPSTPTTSPTTTPTPKEIELFRIGYNVEPDTLDPHVAAGIHLPGYLVLHGTYLARDWRNGSLINYLADAVWFEEEGKVVYIKLKPNLKFADGTPVNSTAIKYTYERLLSKRAPVLGVFGQLERVEVVDELTAKLVFTMPYGPVLLSLTWDFFTPLSPSYINIVGDANFGRKALSTGPFYVVEWRAGDYIIYERNQYYLRRPDIGGEGPVPIKRIMLKFIRDPAALVSALLAGDVDLIPVPQELFSQLVARNNTDIVVVTYPSSGHVQMIFNCEKWPFSDVKVRRAISIILGGTDTRGDISNILHNLVIPIWGPLHTTMIGYNPALEQYAKEQSYYNLPLSQRISKAQELLKEAGWEDRDGDGILEYINGTKFEFPLLFPMGVVSTEEAEYITGVLSRAGIKLNIETLEQAPAIPKIAMGDFYISFFAWGFEDPTILMMLFHSSFVRWTKFSSPELDNLLLQIATTVDPSKRQTYIDGATKILIDNAPWIPLYQPVSALAWRSEYTGITINRYEGGVILFELITKK